MDRKRQLANVAFGGDWSEGIAPREALTEALAVLAQAVELSAEEDVRTEITQTALSLALTKAARGDLLRRAWMRAASNPDPAMRKLELARCLRNIESVVGVAAG